MPSPYFNLAVNLARAQAKGIDPEALIETVLSPYPLERGTVIEELELSVIRAERRAAEEKK